MSFSKSSPPSGVYFPPESSILSPPKSIKSKLFPAYPSASILLLFFEVLAGRRTFSFVSWLFFITLAREAGAFFTGEMRLAAASISSSITSSSRSYEFDATLRLLRSHSFSPERRSMSCSANNSSSSVKVCLLEPSEESLAVAHELNRDFCDSFSFSLPFFADYLYMVVAIKGRGLRPFFVPEEC